MMMDQDTPAQGKGNNNTTTTNPTTSTNTTDKMEGTLPPPPPAGATLPPSIKEQRERVKEAYEEANVMSPGDVWYPTSIIWWSRWKEFVGYGLEEGGEESENEDLHPGRLDNSALLAASSRVSSSTTTTTSATHPQKKKQRRRQQQQAKPTHPPPLELNKALQLTVDYVLLPEAAYTLLKEWYTGGPDLPRTVISVGQGVHEETRVELFPVFVSVSSGDSHLHCGTSRESLSAEHGGCVCVNGTLSVEEFWQVVCKKAGVEVEYAEMYVVKEEEEEEEEEGGEEEGGRAMEASPPRLGKGGTNPQGEGGEGEGGEEDEEEEEESKSTTTTTAPATSVPSVSASVCGASTNNDDPIKMEEDDLDQSEGGGGEHTHTHTHTDTDTDTDTDTSTPLPPPVLEKLPKVFTADAPETVAELFCGETRVRVFVENTKWRFQLKVGDRVDAQDTDGFWYDSEVVAVSPPPRPKSVSPVGNSSTGLGGISISGSGGSRSGYLAPAAASPGADTHTQAPQVKIHYRCWASKWDTNMRVVSEKIQPLFTVAPDWRKFYVGMGIERKKNNKWHFATVVEVLEGERRLKCRIEDSGDMSGSGYSSHSQIQTPQTSSQWIDFDSEEICRRNVHVQDPQPPKKDETSKATTTTLSAAAARLAAVSTTTGGGLSTSLSSSSSSSTSMGGGGHVLGSSGTGTGTSNLLTTIKSPSTHTHTHTPYGRSASRGGSSLAPGVVGLNNLGNTCFMNSMLQCLSNTGLLTEFFLSGNYEGEINESNPLGMKGVLVRVYAKLLRDMWGGDFTSVAPTEFKRIISQKAPQFAGYQQHDSQELMSFLLDGIHEDLNRVRQKPYVSTKDYEGEPDAELAGESWRKHLLRNDSIVIDHCQGQYKSHVTCPKCGYESVTFDPYLSLTLPLPVTSTVKVAFTFHAWPMGSAPPLSVAATLPTTATAKQLKMWIVNNLIAPPPPPPPSCGAGNGNGHAHTHTQTVEDEDSMMKIDPPAPAPLPPRPYQVIDLAELYDKRFYKDFKDSDPILALASANVNLQAFELAHAPSPFPLLPPSTSSLVSKAWPLSKSNSPPRSFLSSGSKTPPKDKNTHTNTHTNTPPSIKEEEKEKEPEPEKHVVVSVLFSKITRRTLNIGSPSYERFGFPVRFTLPYTHTHTHKQPPAAGAGAGTGGGVSVSGCVTNHDVHAQVMRVAQRFLREAALKEGGGESGGGGLGDDDDSGVGVLPPYRLHIANAIGMSVEGEVADDERPFDVKALQRHVLMVVFENGAFLDWVDKDEAERKDAHASVRRESMDDSSGGKGRKVIKLKQCLEKFSEREQLGEDDLWFCSKCKELMPAYKKMDVWSLPDVLILHLKRFSYVQGLHMGHTREKIEDLVDFPVEGLDMRDVMRGPVDEMAPPVYDLYAVSEHSGGLGGGHYTAVAKNYRNKKWYSFNDSFVAPLAGGGEGGSEEMEEQLRKSIVTPRAYVLFYKRRKGELKWAGAKPPKEERQVK